jgi:branched-chain amino acid transport system ATP-binding protein
MTMEGRRLIEVRAHQVIGLGIAHVPENRRLFPRLTVEENLKMGAFLPPARARFTQRLEQVYALFPRMKERRAQPAGTLSGGEQQMLAIGRGLMARPKLLIIDEASLGLAPVIVKDVFSIVANINDDGVTVILIEQNVGALEVADVGLVMEQGRIVAEVRGEELDNPAKVREIFLG